MEMKQTRESDQHAVQWLPVREVTEANHSKQNRQREQLMNNQKTKQLVEQTNTIEREATAIANQPCIDATTRKMCNAIIGQVLLLRLDLMRDDGEDNRRKSPAEVFELAAEIAANSAAAKRSAHKIQETIDANQEVKITYKPMTTSDLFKIAQAIGDHLEGVTVTINDDGNVYITGKMKRPAA